MALPADDIPTRQLYIGGRWVPPARGGRLPCVCPITEQVIGSIPAGTAEDVEAAVAAAQAAVAARSWSGKSGAQRAGYLRAIADKVCGVIRGGDQEGRGAAGGGQAGTKGRK